MAVVKMQGKFKRALASPEQEIYVCTSLALKFFVYWILKGLDLRRPCVVCCRDQKVVPFMQMETMHGCKKKNCSTKRLSDVPQVTHKSVVEQEIESVSLRSQANALTTGQSLYETEEKERKWEEEIRTEDTAGKVSSSSITERRRKN
ncbi:uncharacterized protein RBU57_008900 isoform 1-T1 [Macrochelys suwanniensis]